MHLFNYFQSGTAIVINLCTIYHCHVQMTPDVTIPPLVGPTVWRVAYIIRIGLRPHIVPEDLPRVLVVVVTGLRLHSYVPCLCVMCRVPPLPAYYRIR